MNLPSRAKVRCRCWGMCELATLLGMCERSRNSLLRSSSLTCRATASFLCTHGKLRLTLSWTFSTTAHRFFKRSFSPVSHPNEFHWFQSRTWTTRPHVWVKEQTSYSPDVYTGTLHNSNNRTGQFLREWKKKIKHFFWNTSKNWPCVGVQVSHEVCVIQQLFQALTELYISVQPGIKSKSKCFGGQRCENSSSRENQLFPLWPQGWYRRTCPSAVVETSQESASEILLLNVPVWGDPQNVVVWEHEGILLSAETDSSRKLTQGKCSLLHHCANLHAGLLCSSTVLWVWMRHFDKVCLLREDQREKRKLRMYQIQLSSQLLQKYTTWLSLLTAKVDHWGDPS